MSLRKQLSNLGRRFKRQYAEEHVTLFPFTGALLHYQGSWFFSDTRAALNVTLLAIAQAIAFSAIAGLPVVYGILSTAVAALVAPFFSANARLSSALSTLAMK